jgi:glutamate-1-semialdehyde aminotransferase
MTLDLGLKPDFLTIGKAIAGGIPVGTFGMTEDVANSIKKLVELEIIDTGGIGSTLAGNAMSLAAMRATLSEVLTAGAFKSMIALGDRWSDGVDAAIAEFDLDWHCNRLGARGEYIFKGKAPRTWVSEPGAKRIAYFFEETIWTTIHGTDETDVDKIEEKFIEKNPEKYIEQIEKETLVIGENVCHG